MSERTPAGGDRSEILYVDADGRPVADPADAVDAEVREYAGDVMIRRTYLGRRTGTPAWTPPGDVVGEPDASDTAKATWDVYASENGLLRLANTTDSLLSAMGLADAPNDDKRAFLLNLMRLPSYAAAPQELKRDVEHWLASH